MGKGGGRVIGVDGRNLDLPHGTGVATYAGALCRSMTLAGFEPEVLAGSPDRSRPARWLAAAWPGSATTALADPDANGVRRRTSPDLFRVAQVHFDVWRRLRPVSGRDLPPLMHWTYPLPLRLLGRPNLYTVHDLIPLLHPGLTGIDGVRTRRMLGRIAEHAARFVTVSEATRQELIAHLGIAPDRVTNTWQAVDVAGAEPGCLAGLMPGGYWLHVGAIERRKNVRRLIAAWQASGTRLPLVLAGPDGWNCAEQLAGTQHLRRPEGAVEGTILRLPWLARPALLALVRDARALLMPSLAEGFGLPVAEAMALGTPVLTSDGGALAEVAGRAGLLVPPADGQAIAAGLRALESDADLRGRLSDAGVRRARLFSVEAYAARLAALYAAQGVAGVGP